MTPQEFQNWTKTWEDYMRTLSPFTYEERAGFLLTLRQIRALPVTR